MIDRMRKSIGSCAARAIQNDFWRAAFEKNSALLEQLSKNSEKRRDHGGQHDRADEKEAFCAEKK
jgi:hypothetical protein